MPNKFSLFPFLILLISLSSLHVSRSDPTSIHQVVVDDSSSSSSGGPCSGIAAPATCPVNCFRADPVCGSDGVTYWCGCPDATCHGVRVAKLGACEVGSAGSASLPGQALLLIHMVWLLLLGFSLLLGLF